MSRNGNHVEGLDVPLVKLVPRTERKVNSRYLKRIEASLRAVGLIDPLVVYPHNGVYEILDGCLRYRILLEMGVESVPCLVADRRESFTGNRMVNQLSASQEMRMLRKSLEELDEKTIAGAFGLEGIKHRLNITLLKKLAPEVAKMLESNKISIECAKELSHVKPERQREILELMKSCNDHGVTFAKGLVLKTPVSKRVKANGRRTPWSKAEDNKRDLLKRLRDAEEQQDFYSGLYRQYTTNLLKLVIYVRSLLSNERVRLHIAEHHSDQLELLGEIIDSTEGEFGGQPARSAASL